MPRTERFQSANSAQPLPAGAGRFERSTWIVEPDIDAPCTRWRHDIVILNKHEAIRECRVAHHLGNLLQHTLAGLMMWMRFLRRQIALNDQSDGRIQPGQYVPHLWLQTAGKADGQKHQGLSTFESLFGTRETLHDAPPVRTHDAG